MVLIDTVQIMGLEVDTLTPYISEQVRYLKAQARNRHISNVVLAQAAGVSKATMDRLVGAGGRGSWRIGELDAVCAVLGADMGVVVGAALRAREEAATDKPAGVHHHTWAAVDPKDRRDIEIEEGSLGPSVNSADDVNERSRRR